MWIRPSPAEDEEALLPSSPSLTAAAPGSGASYSSLCSRSPSLLLATTYRLLQFTIPSFLRRQHNAETIKTSEKHTPFEAPKKSSTEYLDGVRGLASLIVFVFHWTHMHFPAVNTGYKTSLRSSIWQLPMIRFVYSGAAMVSIFFTVSGFVLTHRFIQKMHSGDFASLYSGLTSLTFRRMLRLFLPALASCILAFVCVSLGLIPVPEIPGHKPFQHDLWALIKYVDRESNPWTWDVYMKGFYNPQLWSISLEFRGSMVVFLLVLALAKTRTIVRLAVESAVILHAFAHKRWDVALFVAGMAIAEAEIIISTSITARSFVQKRSTKALLVICVLVGVWLSGYPRDGASKSLGYKTLSHQWPEGAYRRRFWLGVASILIVAPMPFLLRLQAFFNTKLIRYCGKISFALYLIHGLGNRTIGLWMIRSMRQMFSTDSFRADVLCYLLSSILYVPLIIWWSDMFWRAFDVPSTYLAKWTEVKCASRRSS